jgi:hypothetical protein
MQLSMHLESVNVDKVVINTDNIGGLSKILIKTQLNLGMKVIIPIANSILAEKVLTIPDHFTKYFLLSDIVISYYNSFLMFGLTITFVDPSTVELYMSADEDYMLQ